MGKIKIYYPVNLDIYNKRCLVIGGGKVAERKVLSLLKYGAIVKVVSPTLTPALQRLNSAEKIEYIKDIFNTSYLKGTFLVIGATNNPDINTKVFHTANKRRILTNIVDSPEECNFIVPSVVKRGELLISISTCGNSPALAKKIRMEIEKKYGAEYSYFLRLMSIARKKVLNDIMDNKKRALLFQKLVYSNTIIRLIKKGNKVSARRKIDDIIERFKDMVEK